MSWQILDGDARERLRELPDESVQTCITSPPYWGLRDYGTGTWEGGDPDCDHRGLGRPADGERWDNGDISAGQRPRLVGGPARGGDPSRCRCGAARVDDQLGLEPTPERYVAELVGIFREVRRVLRADGTLWLNLGDSYNAYNGNRGESPSLSGTNGHKHPEHERGLMAPGLKNKDLVGIPWMAAFALRADGWWLRSEIVWNKPNPMPESVTDRPTKSHEQIFLLTKAARYHYDHKAIREPDSGQDHARNVLDGQPSLEPSGGIKPVHRGLRTPAGREGLGRNKRSVWTVTLKPFNDAHFATFPPDLIEPCVLAGARKGDTVLDPFAGAGTTGMVALRHDRVFVGIELNPEYAEMARNRIRDDAPLLNVDAEVVAA